MRGGYFAVLVARENMKVSGALTKLTAEVYDIQVDMVARRSRGTIRTGSGARPGGAGKGCPRSSANRYTSAWKQLAASMGLPGMPATELAGRIDIPIPRYNHAKVLARTLERHTDILTARNTFQKAQFNLKLAQVTPVPDVTVHGLFQKDYTAPPNIINTAVQVSIPVPIWDPNEGGIIRRRAIWLTPVTRSIWSATS